MTASTQTRTRHRSRRRSLAATVAITVAALTATSAASAHATPDADGAREAGGKHVARACDAPPRERTTARGVDFLRTPDSCFENLTDWPYEPRYVTIDGLRQAYVDEGPKDADPILLLHGQPSWSYLYRTMIPELVARGHRVIAMDHLGMGRSDKPVDPDYYTFDIHAERLTAFMKRLRLKDTTLFAQDWGSIIGLWNAAEKPRLFDRIVIGNGGMPDSQEAFELLAADDPGIDQFREQVASAPADQPPFCAQPGATPTPTATPTSTPTPTSGSDTLGFAEWAGYSYHDESFRPSVFLEALTCGDLAPGEEAAYDAPFPSRDYMASPRVFPTLTNDLVGRTDRARERLARNDRPLLTIFGGSDPGLNGEGGNGQPWLTTEVAGAQGQPHHLYPDAGHFLQEEQGPDIARRIDEFIAQN
jgi:haloalkane dehalogenase